MAGLESLAIDGIGATFGLPPGTASTVMNTVSNLFPCLGSESFGPEPYKRFVAYVDKRISESTTMKMLTDALTFISEEIPRSDLEISRFDSPCSKKYRAQYRDYCKSLITKYYNPSKMRTQPYTGVDFKGASYNCLIYFPIGNYNEPVNLTQIAPVTDLQQTITNDYLNQLTGQTQVSSLGAVPTTTGLESQILPSELSALQTYATTNGIQLTDLIPKFLNGQITVQNGKVIWGVSATNQEPTNQYLLFGAIGLIAFALLRKKK